MGYYNVTKGQRYTGVKLLVLHMVDLVQSLALHVAPRTLLGSVLEKVQRT